MDGDSTLTPEGLTAGRDIAEPATAPGLTIIWHPDVDRIGDRLCFEAPVVEVARHTPSFYDRRDDATGPLADPFVSRTPLTFADEGDGVVVDGSAVVDGELLAGPRTVDASALERGVTVELAGRVTLLLHAVPLSGSAAPDLGLVGDSLAIQRLREDIVQAGLSPAPVLIRGETGVGKELVARAVHRASPRAAGAYRAVNVAAVPTPVAASAFFGHVRGAFSGAEQAQPGYFVESDGGTLFLDEIGDLPSTLQPMLLRALESGEIQPVGDRRTRKVDVRIISATDRALETAVEHSRFSRPLMYRLIGIELHVPPLRDRRDDIGRLLLFGLRKELSLIGAPDRLAARRGRRRPWLAASTAALLCRYDWPGNVRELLNVARQLALAGHRRERVGVEHVPALRRIADTVAEATAARDHDATRGSTTRIRKVTGAPGVPAPLVEDGVLEALEEARWSVAGAAELLGVAKSTLYRYADRTGVIRRARDISDDEIREAWSRLGGERDAVCDALRISPRALAMRINELSSPLASTGDDDTLGPGEREPVDD